MAILPAYFLSVERKNLAEEKLQIQENDILTEADLKTDQLAADLNLKLSTIEKVQGKGYAVSEKIVLAVLAGKVSGIKIERIYFENAPKGMLVNVSGTASSRERLFEFQEELVSNKAFQKVDLPVSNFIQGSNIKFHLDLIPA